MGVFFMLDGVSAGVGSRACGTVRERGVFLARIFLVRERILSCSSVVFEEGRSGLMGLCFEDFGGGSWVYID